MSPIPFSDIGKTTKDLLSKDYPFGLASLEVKTTSLSGLNFTVTGSQDFKSGLLSGELKSKYADKSHGLTFTETFSTANLLTGQVELQDALTKGLKLELKGSIVPTGANQTIKAGLEFRNNSLLTRSSLDISKAASFTSDAVFSYDRFLFGAEGTFNTRENKITKYTLGAAYRGPDYDISLLAQNSLSVFSLSYYHRVSRDVEAGAKTTFDSRSQNVVLEVGTKVFLDNDAYVKAKVDNAGKLGISLTQNIRKGVKLTLAGSFDTTKVEQNAKIGLGLVFEA